MGPALLLLKSLHLRSTLFNVCTTPSPRILIVINLPSHLFDLVAASSLQRPLSNMSDAEKPKRPPTKRADSEVSSTAEDDPGYESRSRSQSRRRRRQNQRQRQAQSKAEAGNAKAESKAMTKVQEEEEPEEHEDSPYLPRSQWLKNPATQDTTEAQPFSRIKPPGQSMDGPVTYARMMRGEIPWRGAPPTQPYETTQGVDAKTSGPDPMDQDGLKLRLELNLDIEIELKASIHGDLTLALL
jgi:hypothetical protein